MNFLLKYVNHIEKRNIEDSSDIWSDNIQSLKIKHLDHNTFL